MSDMNLLKAGSYILDQESVVIIGFSEQEHIG